MAATLAQYRRNVNKWTAGSGSSKHPEYGLTLTLRQNAHACGDPFESFESLVELGAAMLAGEDKADACFAFGDGGESNAGGHDAFIEKRPAEIHGSAAFADDDGRDGSFRGGRGYAADVEAGAA